MIEFPGKSKLRVLLSRTLCRRARCAFVLSTGRCGTTTLTSVLALSDRVRSVHEPKPLFLAETQQAYQDRPLSKHLSRTRAREYSFSRFNALLDASRSGPTYVESSNRLTYFAPFFAEFFINAKFIHLYRHPADVVRSAMRRRYYMREKMWDNYRITPTSDDRWFQEWQHWDTFQKSCWYWQAVNRFSLEFIATLDPSRTMSLRAEELFSPNGEAALSIFDFLSIPRPDIDRVREAVTTPENVQTQGEFPKWKDWTDSQRETLQQIAGEIASKLGYALTAAGRAVSAEQKSLSASVQLP